QSWPADSPGRSGTAALHWQLCLISNQWQKKLGLPHHSPLAHCLCWLHAKGKQATLTCTAPGLCSGSLPKIIWKWRGAGENDSYITGNITAFKTENLTAGTKRHSSTLTISPSAEHHGTNITCKVRIKGGPPTEKTLTLNVNYVKDIQITRDTSVKEGESLNLTCSVESFPPSVIMWTKLMEENIQNGTEANLAMSSFTIFNVTVEDSGQYICTAKHLNNTLKETVNVTVLCKYTTWCYYMNFTKNILTDLYYQNLHI
uniref:Ig-like domain-containing protein n=1 Tax=Acanthochromis polyacanthus TaxID=80966 RepID=A0A3Q1FQV6_9TELE